MVEHSPVAAGVTVRDLYRRRFGGDEHFRNRMWQILCREFFQKFIPPKATVMEVGAGYCEFINNIEASRKIAVDINPDASLFAAQDVQVILNRSDELEGVGDATVDVVFASNFFEHLERSAIEATIDQVWRVLSPGGRLIILQPNYRYCHRDYWMFFDHITAIDDRALVELLESKSYRIARCIPRFLPYTMRSRLPKSLLAVRLYLRMPLLWRLFGAQAFIVAEKPA
jgi:SAM-dependent methyltransferase